MRNRCTYFDREIDFLNLYYVVHFGLWRQQRARYLPFNTFGNELTRVHFLLRRQHSLIVENWKSWSIAFLSILNLVGRFCFNLFCFVFDNIHDCIDHFWLSIFFTWWRLEVENSSVQVSVNKQNISSRFRSVLVICCLFCLISWKSVDSPGTWLLISAELLRLKVHLWKKTVSVDIFVRKK